MDLVGDSFAKFYVCSKNKWNPYADNIKSIPEIYWILAFNFLQVEHKSEWENMMQPHAELIGQLTRPEVFKEYIKAKEKQEKMSNLEEGQEYYSTTAQGFEGSSVANARFDPAIGLVDNAGNIIIPKEKYEKMIGMEGVAISW